MCYEVFKTQALVVFVLIRHCRVELDMTKTIDTDSYVASGFKTVGLLVENYANYIHLYRLLCSEYSVPLFPPGRGNISPYLPTDFM